MALVNRKYYFVTLEEVNGGYEYLHNFVINAESEQATNDILHSIILGWYSESYDPVSYDLDAKHLVTDGGAITLELHGMREIPREHWEVLRHYIYDMTPDAEDFVRTMQILASLQ